MFDMMKMMGKVKEMQTKMKEAQEELASMEVTGEAGAGMVSVVMTGKHEVRRVNIDDSLMEDDKDMLEDLIAAAINDASHKIEAATKEKFSGMGAGMNLPEGMKLPF